MGQLETPSLRHRLDDDALDSIFRTARTYNGWLEKPVSDETLRELYDLMKWGADERQRKPHPVPAPADEGCEGAAASGARTRQCPKDDVRTRDGDRWL